MTTKPTAVFLIWGDSRTAYSDKPATSSDPRVLAWDASKAELVIAEDPLYHIDYGHAKTGYAVEFGKMYADKHDVNVVLVPAGQAGSGYGSADWREDGHLYNTAVERFNNAYAATENAVFGGMLGVIGANNIQTINFAELLDDTIDRFRSDLSGATAESPSVLLELQEDFIYTNGREAIQKVIEDFPNRVQYSAVVDNEGIASNNDILDNGDTTHDYDVTTIAERFLSGLDDAIANDNPAGSQITPSLTHRDLKITEEGENSFILSVSFTPLWMDPAPEMHEWILYRSDNADLSNPEEVTRVETSARVHKVTLDNVRPESDGKYYFAGLSASNEHGESIYYGSEESAYANDGIVANSDQATGQEGETIIIDVLDNDTSFNEEELTIIEATDTNNGTVTIKNNELHYDAANGFTGETEISYTIQSDTGKQAQGYAFVTVEADPDKENKDIEKVYFNAAEGTSLNELYLVSEGDDVVNAAGGYDVIISNDGDDTIFGGDNDDKIWGNDGDDHLSGDAGQDLIYGGNGIDRLYGGEGNDKLYGGNDSDIIRGDAGNDSINGNNGNDYYLSGGSGDDIISGNDGNDLLSGGNGNDILIGGAGRDKIIGGNGNDTFSYLSDTESVLGSQDIIQDFQVGMDNIDLSALGIQASAITITQEEKGYSLDHKHSDFSISVTTTGGTLTISDIITAKA